MRKPRSVPLDESYKQTTEITVPRLFAVILNRETTSILAEPARFCALAADLAGPKLQEELNALPAFAERFLGAVYDADGLWADRKETEFREEWKRLQKQLQELPPEQQKAAEQYLDAFRDILGWPKAKAGKKTGQKAGQTTPPDVSDDAIQKLLDQILEDAKKDNETKTDPNPGPRSRSPVDDGSSSTPPSTSPKKSPKIAAAVVILLLLVGGLCLWGYFGSQRAQNYTDAVLAGETEQAEEILETYFNRVPLSDLLLRNAVQQEISNQIDLYNQGDLTYEDVCERMERLTVSGMESFTDEMTAYLETLSASKECYDAGVDALEEEDYVEATVQFSDVITADSLYADAQTYITTYAYEFNETLYVQIDTALEEDDSSTIYSCLATGANYSTEGYFNGMTSAMDECGNPFVYVIAEQIYDNIKTIQKSKGKKCYRLMIYQMNNREYVLAACFNRNKNAIIYYKVTTDGVVSIEEDTFQSYLTSAGKLLTLTFDWDKSLKKAEKEALLYEEMLQFGPTYDGTVSDLSSTSANLVSPGSNQSSGLGALKILMILVILFGGLLAVIGLLVWAFTGEPGIFVVGAIIVGIACIIVYLRSDANAVSVSDLTASTNESQQTEEAAWPEDALEYDGHMYAIYNIEEEGLESWDETETFCEELGGHLAVIDSQEENDALYQYVLECGLHLAFFGYSDQDEEGNWRWITGDSSYTNWLSGQPNNGAANANNSTEDYAEFSESAADGTWNDAPFGANTYHFICEWDYVD